MFNSAHKGIFASVFIVMLGLATFSLVLTDWTGSFRAGTGVGDITKMKGDRLTVPEFNDLVSRAARVQGMSPQDAYERGLVTQILSSEIWQRLLNMNARTLGVRVSDAQLLAHLKELAAPIAGQEKVDVADVIKSYIRRQGMNEDAFLSSMRRDMENDMVRGVVSGGGTPSALVQGDVIAFEGQTRAAHYIVLKDDAVTVPDPTDAQIAAYYTSRQADFMLPERRDVQVAVLTRASLADKVTIDPKMVESYFNAHPDEFKKPESRVVEFAVFKDKKQAAAVVDAVKGQSFQKEIKQKWPTATVDQNTFERSDSLPDYLKPAFEAKVGDVVGPVETPLGVYVMRVDSVTPPRVMTLDQARPKIEASLRDDAIGDHIDKVMDDLNTAVDRGDTMAAVATAFHVSPVTMTGLGRDGKGSDGTDLMKEYASVKGPLLTAVFGTTETHRVLSPIELSNGDIAIVSVLAVTPEHPQPLESIKAKLVVDYMATKKREANMVSAQSALTDLVAEKSDLAKIASAKGIAVQTVDHARRDDKNMPPALDRQAWVRLFAMPPGVPIMEPVSSGMMLAVVDSVTLADPRATDPAGVQKISDRLQKEQAEEQIVGYMGSLSDRYAPHVNDALIKRMFQRKSEE